MNLLIKNRRGTGLIKIQMKMHSKYFTEKFTLFIKYSYLEYPRYTSMKFNMLIKAFYEGDLKSLRPQHEDGSTRQ